jgi:glycosyltransferase involved in cell wall biosynthesis
MSVSSGSRGALISILLPDLRGGGAERIALDLAHVFASHGYVPEFVLLQCRGDLLSETSPAYGVIDLGCNRVRHLPLSLAAYLRVRRPNALLVSMWPLTAIAPLVQKMSGHHCSVVVSEHNTLSFQYGPRGLFHRAAMRSSMALGYRLAGARIAVSSGVADDLALLSGLPREEFTVVNNPVSPRSVPTPEALELAATFWAAPLGKRILSVGSFKLQKNHGLLLRSFARVFDQDARLMLLGQGDQESSMRSLANDLGIAHRVVFAGFHPDPTPFYATADLFVLSSNYEGFGNVIVEALAQGLPVVSTDCPSGPAEILENGRWGRLVPVGDANALAIAIKESLEAEHDRDALRRRAADFAPVIAAKKYLDLMFSA